MSKHRRFDPRPGVRQGFAALALLPVLLPSQVLADASADRLSVMTLTTLVVAGSLLVCTVGYLFRRTRGMDHPTPDQLEMAGSGHGPDAADAHGAPGGVGETHH